MSECCHGAGGKGEEFRKEYEEGDEGVLYICPMCEGVEKMGPGECPMCGMALEPLLSKDGSEGRAEKLEVRRRLFLGVLLMVPLMGVEMLGVLGYEVMPKMYRVWWGLLLSSPIVWWLGFSFFEKGVRSLRSGSLNMYTLIMMGTGVAWFYSATGTFFPDIFPESVKSGGVVEVYYEAASMIVVLVLWGRLLEIGASERTGDAVRSLMDLSPKKAWLVEEGGEREVVLSEVREGSYVRIKPGERVSVDGEVSEGESEVDVSMVTGEPLPVVVREGMRVVGGSLNGSGSVIVRVDRVGSATMLSQIVLMVARARLSKASVQGLVDRVSSIFVPLVVGVSLVTFLVWFFVSESGLSYGVVSAVSVLLIACPCALGLATPLSITVGVGRGVKEGVLVRDVSSLEMLEKVDVVIFDKTGTLTRGRPEVVEVWSCEEGGEDEVLRWGASLGEASEHPLSRALVEKVLGMGMKREKVKDFEVVVGEGVKGMVGGKRVVVGNEKMCEREGIDVREGGVREGSEREGGRGWTRIYVGRGGDLMGVVWLSDRVKEGAKDLVESLKKRGLRLILLTGDSEDVASYVGGELGLVEVHGGVSPKDKGSRVKELQGGGFCVLMVGDGVNDAPSLSLADVGIAMGTGTDIAMESAGITLLHGDVGGVEKAIHLSEAVMGNIRQNIFFAFVYNVVGVLLASGIFYPVWGVLLSPMVAAFAMSMSSVSVMTNALRLRLRVL